MEVVRRFLERYGELAGLSATAVILLAVGWIGLREGAGQVYAGQVRTLAELRAAVQRLSRAIAHMGKSHTFAPGFLEDWDTLERGLRDLEPPGKRSREPAPAGGVTALKHRGRVFLELEKVRYDPNAPAPKPRRRRWLEWLSRSGRDL